MNKTIGDVLKSVNVNNIKIKNNSFMLQCALSFLTIYACICHSSKLEYYYNTILGRIFIISAISISCSFKYMFFTLIFVMSILFISFKTYEGFSLTDVDSITTSIKSNLPASMVSLPANPTPQNIYDYLNKQICTAGNSDIYSQIASSTSSSADAKTLASTALALNGAMCKSGSMFYQNPQGIFDDFANTCASNPQLSDPDKKLMALASSVTKDTTSSNVFSAPLIAIANWISTTQSAICGATPTAPAAAVTAVTAVTVPAAVTAAPAAATATPS